MKYLWGIGEEKQNHFEKTLHSSEYTSSAAPCAFFTTLIENFFFWSSPISLKSPREGLSSYLALLSSSSTIKFSRRLRFCNFYEFCRAIFAHERSWGI